MHNHYSRRRSQPIVLAGVATLAVFLIFLFVVVQGDDDPPHCPVSHSGAVDMVPSGIRPCVLYGSGTGVATGYGYQHGGTSHSGTSHSGSTPRSRSTVKAPGAPKAPAVKVPAAPKPAAPKVITRR
ncbi:hypothetical protein HCJ76_44045 [Streptomyces sp. MC1]|uniref:hypothetical protein n=1 Tax=Streptomyces sp. MC1 TaxID=295105 RepID=UPI0018CA32CD|nr:hypothetical protein [Streptomyces sp. MC1]MBG7704856.1 hypothetical protein [Streptomyces sp. MC1]